eukprot:TRINITY_DN7568_c0_g1_i1.p1 TRINITY_DN7568_c0_g1~~TRINITY_DN7568_c0_g1_i1.p1  ORF type:complete len:629 (+),score=132.49 TRINITY_DN7568_c0_g1_i1:34-1887(+)
MEEEALGLVPQPASVELRAGHFELRADAAFVVPACAPPELRDVVELCASQLRGPTGFALPLVGEGAAVAAAIAVALDAGIGPEDDEGYVLDVAQGAVHVRAAGRRGAFYGLQTFRQLLPPEAFGEGPGPAVRWLARCVHIEDRPRFCWRSVMLDCSRTFFDMDFLYRYVDWLSVHKFNIFHWHLTDNEGWRLEIRALPELTRAGAWYGAGCALPVPSFRCAWFPSGARNGGFYSQEDVRLLVRYAAARCVDVLPEIDLPGHSSAAAAAMPEILCENRVDVTEDHGMIWCVGREQNYALLDRVLDELCSLFPFRYVHLGGDEVDCGAWLGCPRCTAMAAREGLPDAGSLQPLFTRRLAAALALRGKLLVGWEEIAGSVESSSGAVLMSWTGAEPGCAAAKNRHQVVMCPGAHAYLDMAQGPGERGHSWAGRVPLSACYALDPLAGIDDPSVASNVVGVAGCLWSEFLLEWPALGLADTAKLHEPNPRECPAPAGFAEYQTWPRAAALAEAAWTPAARRGLAPFLARLGGAHLARLSRLGMRYRVPEPRVMVRSDGRVAVEAPWPGAELRYETDDVEPGPASLLYVEPFECAQPSRVRAVAVAPDGRTSIAVRLDCTQR